jgi:intracellular sulfur oxidation DsrE/DsrF family protein
MKKHNLNFPSQRREFLGTIASGVAALGLTTLAPLGLGATELSSFDEENNLPDDPDAWFAKIKGKHRIVFDATHPKEVFPFAWPRVFLMTNEKTGSTAKDCGVVVILRHDAIPYAFEDKLWAKYKFGEMFKADDPATKEASVRNPFWKPKKGDFKIPGIGEVAIGINELQDSGVMFCVCDAAITVYSAAAAQSMGMEAADVKKEWLAGLLPKIKVVPSGVWAVGRAQEHGCAYCAIA